jgi:hypothetical protein
MNLAASKMQGSNTVYGKQATRALQIRMLDCFKPGKQSRGAHIEGTQGAQDSQIVSIEGDIGSRQHQQQEEGHCMNAHTLCRGCQPVPNLHVWPLPLRYTNYLQHEVMSEQYQHKGEDSCKASCIGSPHAAVILAVGSGSRRVELENWRADTDDCDRNSDSP